MMAEFVRATWESAQRAPGASHRASMGGDWTRGILSIFMKRSCLLHTWTRGILREMGKEPPRSTTNYSKCHKAWEDVADGEK